MATEKKAKKGNGKSDIVHVSDRDFEEVVLKAKQPVLLDFSAMWCGPCRALAPVLERVAASYRRKAIVAKLDVDKSPETSSRYHVSSIPTLIVFQNGKAAEKSVGLQEEARLAAMLDRALEAGKKS